MRIEPIGHIESPYLTKFGVPRQANLCTEVRARVFVTDQNRCDFVLDSSLVGRRIWLIWSFSLNNRDGQEPSVTVRPPRLGGNQRLGVFATRSSFRPNTLAISCVLVRSVITASDAEKTDDEIVLDVIGCDMVDKTPIYSISPYSPAEHYHGRAGEGWTESAPWPTLANVEFAEEANLVLPQHVRVELTQTLIQDPRPAYTRHGQEERVFWMAYDRYGFSFCVDGQTLRVLNAFALTGEQIEALRADGNINILEMEWSHEGVDSKSL